MEELVSLRGVTRTVRLPDDQDLHILQGVDLTVRSGDHTAVIGRSGCGKSTLLNLLGLLDLPTSGELRFQGTPVEQLGSNARAKLRGSAVGFVFQQFNLLPGRSALDNVITPLLYARGNGATLPWTCWTGWVLPAVPRPCPTCFPEANSNGWPSPGPWSGDHG